MTFYCVWTKHVVSRVVLLFTPPWNWPVVKAISGVTRQLNVCLQHSASVFIRSAVVSFCVAFISSFAVEKSQRWLKHHSFIRKILHPLIVWWMKECRVIPIIFSVFHPQFSFTLCSLVECCCCKQHNTFPSHPPLSHETGKIPSPPSDCRPSLA